MLLQLNSINKKILIGYVAVILVIGAAAALLMQKSGTVSSINEEFSQKQLPNLNAVSRIEADLSRLQLAAFSLYGTTISKNQFQERTTNLQAQVQENLNHLSQQKPDTKPIEREFSNLTVQINALATIMGSSPVDWDGARAVLDQLSQINQKMESHLGNLKASITTDTQEGRALITNQLANMRFLIGGTLLACFGITIIASISAQATIAKPMRNLAEQISQIVRSRDLTRTIQCRSQDEVGITASHVNELIRAFQDENRNLHESTTVLKETAISVERNSKLTDDQATILSQAIDNLLLNISSVESRVTDCAERASSASDMAQTGANQVIEGSNELDGTRQYITQLAQNIEQSSNRLMELKSAGDSVSSVVHSIAEIAEQTNLLALNAAIEAARAGESGRGFAVVADEVRTLATRTQDSTLEINQILDTIVSSIADTVTLMERNKEQANATVQRAQTTVSALECTRETIDSLRNENKVLVELAKTSADQTNQMRKDVEAINTSRSQLIDSSRASRKTCSSLSNLSDSLKNIVSQYRV